MLRVIETATRIKLLGDRDVLKIFHKAFRFKHPNAWRSEKYMLWQRTSHLPEPHGWDGYINPFKWQGDCLVGGRGYLDRVRELVEIHEIKADFSGLLPRPFEGLEVDDIPDDIIVAPFQLDIDQKQAIVDWLSHAFGINHITVSGGKCLAKGTLVMMHNGSVKAVEEIKVGDRLMGPDSKPRKVLSLGSGVDDLYRISMLGQKGSVIGSYVCNSDHILALKYAGRNIPKAGMLGKNCEITVKDFISMSRWKQAYHYGYKVGVEFPERELPLEPRWLGLWLGDGSSREPAIVVADSDPEIGTYVENYAKSFGLSINKNRYSSCDLVRVGNPYGGPVYPQDHPLRGCRVGGSKINFLRKQLIALNLLGNKHIPDLYKYNSRKVRLELLAGLIDSDGGGKKNGTTMNTGVSFAFASKILAEDTLWLARSLGYRAILSPKKTSIKSIGYSGIAYRVCVSGKLSEIPTLVARKKLYNTSCGKYHSSGNTPIGYYESVRYPISVVPAGKGEYYGFNIDKDGLYLLGDFTVTHNTAMFCGAAAMVKRRYPKARFLYVVPTERLIRQVMKEATNFLPTFQISQFGGGKRDKDGTDMVVATSAMLSKHFDNLKIHGWFKSFLCLLIDESHHASSPTVKDVIESTPAFFRLGASDSTKEDDILKHSAIVGLLGPVRHVLGAEKLISAGRLAVPNIYVVDVPDWNNKFSHVNRTPDVDSDAWALIDGVWIKGMYAGPVFEKDPGGNEVVDRDGNPVQVPNYHLMNIDGEKVEVQSRWCLLDRLSDKAIVTFKPRNKLVVDWAKFFSDKGMPTLVVATKTVHIMILQGMLEKVIDPDKIRILYSEHSSRERDEVFDWFRETPGAVMVSSIVKEGVSIPEIRAGIIADFVAGAEVANQLIGRYIRKKPDGDNECHLVWFVDRQSASYRQKSLSLFRKMERTKGYKFYHPVIGPDSIVASTKFSTENVAQQTLSA